MFDLTSLIRQLIPPHRRQPLTIALMRVLFGPAQLVMTGLSALRATLMGQLRQTGQILVLEDLLTKSVANLTNATVYIAEGNDVNVDFTVIVPVNVPASAYGALAALVDRYKLAGKRYTLAKGLAYTSSDNTPGLAWEQGYPYAKDNTLFLAVNQVGTFYVRVVDQHGKVYSDGSFPLRKGSIVQVSPIDPTLTYVVTCGSITASVVPATSFLTASVGYDWSVANGRTLFLGFNASEPPALTLTKPDGSTLTQTASVFGVSFGGTNYTYRAYFPGLAGGRYLVSATVGANSYAGYLTLNDANSGQGLVINGVPPVDNQAPVINRQVARQTAKVGTAYSQIIPADTFADADGSIASIAIAGLPAGLTSQVSGLVVVVSGTPTEAGDKTVRVTGTDNKDASVLMQYVIAVAPNVIAPTPDPELPNLQGILKTDLRPQDYGLLNVVVARFEAGRVYLKDDTTRNADDGKTWLYHIMGKWYTRSQFEAAGWPPFFPLLIYKYAVNTSLPRHDWRKQPTTNDAQKVRYI